MRNNRNRYGDAWNYIGQAIDVLDSIRTNESRALSDELEEITYKIRRQMELEQDVDIER